MEFVIWAFVGWCGTPWRRWPVPPQPGGPQPEPWLSMRLLGVIGGLAGGWIMSRLFDGTPLPAHTLGFVAAASVGAFVGGRVLAEVTSRLTSGKAPLG
jgi:uncharacterized membrane protein YeaQ/YmgE (transglycosylase-associated protein family)